MKSVFVLAAAFALSAAPALAQDVVAGATVTGPEGNAVGTIVSVENGTATLDTGTHKVPLGLDMYGKGETGPTITVTRDQLNAMVDAQLAEAAAKRDAALVAGAEVMDAAHAPMGTIQSVEGDTVVVARDGDAAKLVTMQRDYFTATDHGLMARLTNAQVDEAAAAAAAAQ